MDAHLFKLFTDVALPLLIGARIEKIQEPYPGLLAIGFYGHGLKRQMFCRFSRQKPFCFLSTERLAANAPPSAQIMRMRRYFNNHGIATVVADALNRELWLMAAGHNADVAKKTVWLRLNLARGAELCFLEENAIPQAAQFAWPEPENLDAALADWRAWPVLTPALRKTMLLLEPPERRALLLDLSAGGGDVFLYHDKDSPQKEVTAASAWPLPAKLAGNSGETASSDILPALELAGRDLVLRQLSAAQADRLLEPAQKRAAKIKKSLARLDEDEKKLRGMVALANDAEALRANLWRYPADWRCDSITVNSNGGEKLITLQKRFSLRENMERLFHEARRGKRGLVQVEQRRGRLAAELETLAMPQAATPRPEGGKAPDKTQKLAALAGSLPANISLFISSDGFAILRGKNAKGNLALRRHASGHDLWTHVRDGPGAHVVIRRDYPGQTVPEATLDEAGALAAIKSWQGGASSAWIMYAELRHVKPMRAAAAGNVTIDRLWATRLARVDPDVETRLAAGGQ